VTEEKCF